MSKKLILFLMLALFGSTSFLRADVVEIGDGTSTTYVTPFNSLWGYSYVEQVYTADEIGMAGTINSISFNMQSTDAQTNSIEVYMKNVTRETFEDATDYEAVTAADMVFSGTVTFNTGWTTITLDTPFAYDGTSNLMIGMHEGTSGYSTRYFYYTSKENSVVTFHSDSENPDPFNLGSYGGNKYVSPNRANIQLDITAGGGGGETVLITIGEGDATNTYLPTYEFYNYSLTQQIYTAAEIGQAGTINSIAYYGTATATRNLTVYMVNTDKDAFSGSTDWVVPTAADEVYSGSVTTVANDWTTITLSTPFEYNGTSNLCFIVDDNTGDYVSSVSKRVFEAGGNCAIRVYSDGTNYNALNPTSYSGTTMTVKNQVQISLTTSGGGPTEPWDPDYNAALGTIEIVAPENGEQNVNPTTLRWYNAENAAAYMVEFGTVYGNLEMIALGDATGWEGSVNLAECGIELQNNTRYYWRVTNSNNTGEVSELALFVTTMPTATNVRVTDDEIFTDETTIVKWSITGGGIGDLPETHIGSGTNSNSYLPSYSFYNYSLTQQIYTADEIGGAGLINSISFYNSGSTKTRDYDVYMVNTDKETFAGTNDWITVTADDQVFTGSVTMTAGAWTTLTFADPFFFDGTNLAIIVDDNSGSWESGMSCYSFDATSQAIYVYNDYDDYNPMAPTGYTGTVLNVKNQIVINIGAKGGVTENRELLGCNVYVDDVKVNDEPITERQYTLSGLSYNIEDGHSINVTGVYEIGESEYSNTAYVYVSGYGTATGWVKELMEATPMAGVTVKYDGQDEFGNTVNYQTTTAANGTYTINNIKAGEYTAKAIYAGCETAIEENVVVEYNSTTNVNFYMHEVYTPVYKVYAEEGAIMGNPVADVIWSFNNFTINNGGGGGGGTGNGDTFSVDFEAGLPAGWTTIDNGNPTGYGWDLASVVMSTGYGHNGSADCMVSKSYDNNYGVLYPDNYLVTPQVNIAAGSTFSFYACAQDASYAAEHYGVAISDNATGPWTMVEEWTMTAKEGPKGARGTNEQGNWYQKTVDLSSYAGQKYIAIRHFNCSDQFYLDVDDVELSNGAKRIDSNAEACGTNIKTAPAREMWDLLGSFEGTSAGQQAVATDGNYIYTASWQATPTGGYTFYQYDMNGNFIEGFNISGATGIRDLTTDGEYFYGTSGGANIFVLDFNTRTLVSTISCSGLTSRHIAYDPERDGFWSGNWSTLALYDRNGALVQTGAAPSSAYGSSYFKDADGVEHLYLFCQPSSDAKVYDYNIAANTISGPIFDFATTPGFDAGISGGCFIANYGDKLAFFGNVQQSPNLIGIYELGAAQGGGGGGGSQFATEDHFFRVYRQPVLIENMPEEVEYDLLADNYGLNFADTMYTDNAWNSLPAGIYQYGVSAVYPWCSRNDNNVTDIIWSNYIEKDMETTVIVKANVATGFYQGTVFTLTNVNENLEYVITLDEANTDTIADFRKGEYIVTAALAGYASDYNETEVSIWDATTIEATLIEALTPVSSVEVSGTGYARWTDLIPATDVAMSYYMTLDGMFIGETTSCYEIINPALLEVGQEYIFGVAVLYTTGLSDYEYATFTYIGCNAVDPQVTGLTATNEPGDLNVVLTWNGATPTPPTPPTPGTGTTFTEGFEGGMPTGWNVIDANNDGWTWCMTSAIPTTWTYYASLTLDWYRTGSNAICSGSYINGVGALTPDEYLVTPQVDLVAGSTFSFWAAATDASYPADHFGVFVSDNGTSGWTSVQEWTLTGKKGANGGRESRDGEGAKLGTWYNYSVDLSAYAGQKYIAIRHFNCNDQYIMCVDDIELSAPAKNRDEVTYDFDDSSLQGWTTIDGGSPAGYGWSLASNKMGTGYGHNGSTDCVLSQSYDNNYGVVYPDNYLVSPAKATYSQISFYACAQDASYAAEHFGVAVSTGNASASEFTTIQEWTMTAKGEGASVIGRDGRQTRQGSWYQYTVDLSAYAGQEIWVAIRHFNCSDMFYLDVDDITLTTGGGGGGGGSTATVFTPGKFNILVDGVIVGATSESTYIYEVADYEEHNYTVVYVDADYNISCVVEDENSIDYAAAPLGVDENEVVNAIYPNPTSGDLHINATAMRHISVVNAMGQMVYNQDVNADEMVLNMAQFEAGVYMVNIITENGSSVKRITVVK